MQIDMTGTVRIMVPQLRAEKGIKIQQIADALDISRQTASKIANGKQIPSDPKDLQILCDLFGVDIDELVRTENSHERETA